MTRLTYREYDHSALVTSLNAAIGDAWRWMHIRRRKARNNHKLFEQRRLYIDQYAWKEEAKKALVHEHTLRTLLSIRKEARDGRPR